MKYPVDLFPYQLKAINFQCSHPASALWLDMGLGKTAVTLSSIAHLTQHGFLKGTLIVAPIRVCRLVWRQEAMKWDHTKHLKFSVAVGSLDMRLRALMQSADVYLINYENLGWLAEVLQTYYIKKGRALPFNGIVFDEITKCKNSNTERVKALRKVLPYFTWRTGLTGSPASNGYKDLHGQYLVLDDGKRLGTSKTAFKTRWYHKIQGTYKEVAFKDTEEGIKHLIGDMTLEMSAEDYNPLPDMIVNNVEIEMPDNIREKYEALEREFFLRLDSGAEIELFNQASLTNKLLQFSNGAVYPVPGMPLWEHLHDLKLDALEDILEEANGQPVLCSYAYRSDAERIMHRFKEINPINLTDCKTEKSLIDAMARWRNGHCRLMIGHPASMGHGVDGLQSRGHILVWFGLNWSLDLYSQFNARIRRQGQGVPVVCHRILCKDTLDQAQGQALDEKATTESGLRKAIKDYRKQKESRKENLDSKEILTHNYFSQLRG
jgi:SNF2 family DNA or RNA helicase